MTEIYQDVRYARRPGFRPLALDLYVPADPFGLCVYLHGGGWRVGSRSEGPADGFFARVASLGLAIASVDYRLSGEATWPAQRSDVSDALGFLNERRDTYGIGGDRTFMWGVSAGGQLAAIAALTADVRVDAAVCWYPPTDLDALSKDIAAMGAAGDRSSTSREGQLVGGALDTLPDVVRDASPVAHARPDAPPFLFLHGDADVNVPPRQSERLASLLPTATVSLIPGATHMFPELDADAILALAERSVAFLRTV